MTAALLVPDTAAILIRPRLLEVLGRRWRARVVTVTAGAGFGKTVLLGQAVAENRLAPRGEDLVLACDPAHSRPGPFAAVLAELTGVRVPATLAPGDVVDAVAADLGRRAPEKVCLVVDGADHVGSGASRPLLLRLIAQAAGNVHFLLAARRRSLRVGGPVEAVTEHDLRLDHHELAELAAASGREPARTVGGWPALAALFARSGGTSPSEYLWESVLEELGGRGRRVLASLAAIGGGDRELARSATGDLTLDPADVLAGVPLVDRDGGGAWVPHELWSVIVGTVLDDDDLAATRRRAAGVLLGRGEHDRAFRLFAQADEWEGAALVLRDACSRGYAGVTSAVLDGWLSLWPADRREDAEGLLLRGVVRRARDPFGDRTAELLSAAVRKFRDAGNVGCEVAAAMELAYVSRVRGELEILPALLQRAVELHQEGHREVDGAMAIGRAVWAEMLGDDEQYVAELGAVPAESLSPEWRAAVAFMEFTGFLTLGREGPMMEAAQRCARLGGPDYTGRHAVAVAEWYAGRPEHALQTLDAIQQDMAVSRVDRLTLGAFATLALASSGRLTEAREALAGARAAGAGSAEPLMAGYVAGARALVAVAEGDEGEAAEILRAFLAAAPLTGPIGRRAVTRWLGLAYVLLPEARNLLDDISWGPLHELTLRAARALVAARHGTCPPLSELPARRLAASMPLPWSLGLASAAAQAGDPDGQRLTEEVLELHGERARAALRAVAAGSPPRVANGAKKLLAEIPLPPGSGIELRVLGPTELRVDGVEARDPHWRRERVRALLLYLVCHRRARREELVDALWPDSPVDAATRNLRVTLCYLNRVLEPQRRPGEAPFTLRQLTDELTLAGPPYVRLDVTDFEDLLDRAEEADRRGVPSLARAALEQALALWRGPCLREVAYEDWALPMVRRLERRCVGAAVRAAELALAADAWADAARHAEFALGVDEWSEPAHRVLVAARLAGGDRLGAARAMARCDEMLASIGVPADGRTEHLRRLVRSA